MNPKNLLALLIVAAVGFSSCSKNDNDDDLVGVTYFLKTTNRTSGPITWSSGTGSGKQIEFNGTVNGTRVQETKLSFEPVDFFAANTATINQIKVPAGNYTDVEMNFEMIPSRNPALQLKGSFSGTPVTLNLENFVEISTKTATMNLESGKNYAATMILDLAAITNGITSAMLTSATRTNGEIIISFNSNVALYSTITGNINNKVHTVEVSQ
jgi:hypothetical protein